MATQEKSYKKTLVSTLHHVMKVVHPGRALVTRMYSTAARLRKIHFITRLNLSFQSDLLWWHTFLQAWNGFSILRHPSISHPELRAQTNASGALGCAAVLIPHWLQWQWPLEWQNMGIVAKELLPIILTCIVWGPHLSGHHINFQCDNANLVISINKGSSKDKLVMHLLCSLLFFMANFDIYVTASHLLGVINVTADHVSRGNLHQAFQAVTQAYSDTTFCLPITLTPDDGLDFSSLPPTISPNFVICLSTDLLIM